MRYVYGRDGNVAASIDSAGKIMLGSDPGAAVGVVRSDTDVFSGEAGAEWVGRVDSDRRVFDARYECVGSVDASGRVLDVTGRLVGTAGHPVDGAALLLLVGRIMPELLEPPTPPIPTNTVMDEVIELAAEDSGPGIRKNYKPLTDEDVFGRPHKKNT